MTERMQPNPHSGKSRTVIAAGERRWRGDEEDKKEKLTEEEKSLTTAISLPYSTALSLFSVFTNLEHHLQPLCSTIICCGCAVLGGVVEAEVAPLKLTPTVENWCISKCKGEYSHTLMVAFQSPHQGIAHMS